MLLVPNNNVVRPGMRAVWGDEADVYPPRASLDRRIQAQGTAFGKKYTPDSGFCHFSAYSVCLEDAIVAAK
jgi:hypothetical protein